MRIKICLFLCLSALFITCEFELFPEQEYIQTDFGGISWIGTDTLICLYQEYNTASGFFSKNENALGTKLVFFQIPDFENIKTIELEPKHKIVSQIHLCFQDHLIAYEYEYSGYLTSTPYSFFYSITDNTFDSSKFKNFRILNFASKGNLFTVQGNWEFSSGRPCGNGDCSSGYYWHPYKCAVIDRLGREIFNSLSNKGVPNPVEDVLITEGTPILIKSFPKDSTIYTIQDSSNSKLISWAPDGSKFIFVGKNQFVSIYSYLPTILFVNNFHLTINPTFASLSPNGNYLAFSNKDTIVVFDKNGKQLGIHTF